jgi:hypothetical protein
LLQVIVIGLGNCLEGDVLSIRQAILLRRPALGIRRIHEVVESVVIREDDRKRRLDGAIRPEWILTSGPKRTEPMKFGTNSKSVLTHNHRSIPFPLGDAKLPETMASAKGSILLVFTSKHCVHCRSMERHGAIQSFQKMRPDVTLVKFDLSNGTDATSNSYGVRFVPTFVVLTANGTVLRKASGPKTADQIARLVG